MSTGKISAILSVMAIGAIALAAMPAPAANADKAAKRNAIVSKERQETIALGNNRFLIFSGSPGAYEYAYSVDLVKIDKDGVPHFEPMFMDDYSEENGTVAFSEGVAFSAVSYRFDKPTNTLTYTSRDPGGKTLFAYQYLLTDNMMILQQVMMQDKGKPPQTVYKASDAQTH